MNQGNFHTHTTYSDGKDVPVAYVKEALDQNIPAIGFSDHAPIPLDCTWTMQKGQATNYIEEINSLKATYKGQVEIYCGLEVDYIPGLSSPSSSFIKSLGLDYTIGAIHFVDAFPDNTPWAVDSGPSVWKVGIRQIFNDSVQQAITRYFELTREMVNHSNPTIIAHLDRIKKNNTNSKYYSESEPWYIQQIELTLEAIAAAGSILEVNTKGIYRSKSADPYPSKWVLAKAYELNIPIHLAADAHHPYLITGGFEEALEIISSVGYTKVQVLKDGKWQDQPIFATA